jgi:hypothetical protein
VFTFSLTVDILFFILFSSFSVQQLLTSLYSVTLVSLFDSWLAAAAAASNPVTALNFLSTVRTCY